MPCEPTMLEYASTTVALQDGQRAPARCTSSRVAMVYPTGPLEGAASCDAGVASAVAANNTICDIPVTVGSVPHDLSLAAYAGLLAAIQAGRTLELQADGGKVWYRFATATGTVDETKDLTDTPANQSAPALFDGDIRRRKAPTNTLWLMVKGSVACKLRIEVVSAAPTV